MVTEDWTHLNEILDKRFKDLQSKVDENAATDTRERELLRVRIEALGTRVFDVEVDVEDLETRMEEKGGGDDT